VEKPSTRYKSFVDKVVFPPRVQIPYTVLVWCRHLVLATLDPGLQGAVHCRLSQRCSN